MVSSPISQMRLYTDWLRLHRGLDFDSYDSLWRWSVGDLEGFWRSIWDYHSLTSPTSFKRALAAKSMPGAIWFEGAQVNYTAQVFRHVEAAEADGQPAVISEDERGTVRSLGWRELRHQVAALALTLRDFGVVRGDRVAAYLHNGPEAIVGFLACASLGAIWSVCAPDMGTQAVLDRFRQITPKVLIAVDGVRYAGKLLDRSAIVGELQRELTSLRALVLVEAPEAAQRLASATTFARALNRSESETAGFSPENLPFEHPLWIVYSSGTTGLPKPLVHSHGGLMITCLAAAVHLDLGPSYDANTRGDRYHWYSSTGWVMWNGQVAGLLTGTTICLYDGSPGGSKEAPDWGRLWKFAARNRVTIFGSGAAFYTSCMKARLELAECGDLSAIRTLGSTGSPLPPEVQQWGTAQFAALGTPDIWWCNLSGGSDVCCAFVTGNRDLPAAPGRMQCRHLGVAVEAWNDDGLPVVGKVGELVCVKPIPSMPIFFWGDLDNARYLGSYFDTFPGIWRHGDWLQIDEDGVCTISGRSDATINRQGLRMGTSEVYSAVESLPEILDSMVIDLETAVGESKLIMFLVLRGGAELNAHLRRQVADAIGKSLSPRFIPDEIISAPAVPRTLSGKKQEIPIKRLLQGHSLEKVISRDAMANPEVLSWYIDFAGHRRAASS